MGKPTLINWELIESAGFMRLVKQYSKLCKGNNAPDFDLKDQMRMILRIMDEQDAIGRYKWGNLPKNFRMISDEIERLVYIKGNLILFKFKETDEFMVMPYTGVNIDYNGRFTTVTPVPISNEDGYTLAKEIRNQLENLKLKVFYTIPSKEEIDKHGEYGIAVIIKDYPNQINNQKIIPRYMLNDPMLDMEAEIFPMARTARIHSTGVKGMEVNDEDEAQNVTDANVHIFEAALSGDTYVPIQKKPNTNDLTDGNVAKSEEWMLSLQSMENFRLGTYGIQNNGLFEKKAHVLEGEQDINAGPTNSRMQRGLNIRKNACDIANAVWGLNMTCEISQDQQAEFFSADNISKEGEDNAKSNDASD